MNKTKKGLLTVSSIVVIVASVLGILCACGMFIISKAINEDIVKESFKLDDEYVYVEDADGSYHFTYLEDNKEFKISESEIELMINVVSSTAKVVGIGCLIISIIKLTLAIKILVSNAKNKFNKGCAIALLVLSLLTGSLLEVVLLILALLNKSEKPQIKSLYDIEIDKDKTNE